MINNYKNCTGCGACYNICPQNSITMEGNEFGFYKPVISKDKCVNCGLCNKVCPINYKSKNLMEPNAFALLNKDEIRAKSSSGGAFSAFADYILEKNGIIYGVIWDESIQAIHYRAKNSNELEKIHGSKYVQSNTKHTYKLAKNDLDDGKLVLYSGTPCQIAGLKSYLGQEYDNLLTIDIICHGTQSPLFLERFKNNFLQNKPNEKILNINFRSKKTPWGLGHYTTEITTDKKNYVIKNCYYTEFMDMTLNECCINCYYAGIPRIGDITIGDFWGVDEYNSKLNDKKGTSVVLLNSYIGNSIFNTIKKQYITEELPLDMVIKHNPNIIKPTAEHKRRKEFLEKLKNQNVSIKELTEIPLYKKIYGKLPEFAKNFIKNSILKRKS